MRRAHPYYTVGVRRRRRRRRRRSGRRRRKGRRKKRKRRRRRGADPYYTVCVFIPHIESYSKCNN